MVLFFLLSFIPSYESHCIYTKGYWKNKGIDEWPTSISQDILCGETWHYLYITHYHNNSLWNTTFRSICTALLNNCSKQIGNISLSVLKTMGNQCHNKSGWSVEWKLLIPGIMKEVEVFNNGVGDDPLCPLSHTSTTNPTQKHERLYTLTTEESLQRIQLHTKIIYGLCAVQFIISLVLLRKMVITSRLLQQTPP